MKKILVSFLILFALILSSCEESSVDDDTKKDDTPIGDVTPVDEDPVADDDVQDDYEKAGDIVKYFETFGALDLCGSETDWSNEDCYEIEVVFDDGMTVLMRHYDIEGSVYLTFDFIAEKDGATLMIQVDYYVGFDTSVKYFIGGTLVDGWLMYNGYDQSPMFELNQSYEYTVLGDNAVESMQAMLNNMIVNLNGYFEENSGGSFISTESN
jgi:hypothetical protein